MTVGWLRRLPLVPCACALLAAGLAFGSAAVSMKPRGWSPTALPRVDSGTAMGAAARAIDPGFQTVSPGAYDGQWYWGIAVDPLATGNVHARFDTTPYRYGHPLYGWLGWVFSAGQARAAAAALLVVGLITLAAAALVAGLAGQATGGRGWEGLFVALNPGLLYAASHDLTEPLSAALLLTGLLAYVRGRRGWAVVCFALLVLSKEAFVTVPASIAAWELLRRRARGRETALLAASILPAAVWWVWLRLHLGAWFTANSGAAFVFPLSGWKTALGLAGADTYAASGVQSQLGEATVVVVLALGGLLLVAALSSLRLRDPVEAVLLPLVAVIACLSPIATIYQRDILRNASVALVLVPFVLARRPLRPASAPAPPG